MPSHRAAKRAVIPVKETDTVHRNPNHVATDVADQYGGINPLASRLYSDGLSSGATVGVPNRLVDEQSKLAQSHGRDTGASASLRSLSSSSGRGDARLAASAPAAVTGEDANDAAATRTADRGSIKLVNSLQVFTQPAYADGDLKRIFAASAQQKRMTAPPSTGTKKKQPGKLLPLPCASATGATTTAAGTVSGVAAGDASTVRASRIPKFDKPTSNSPNEFAYLTTRQRGIRDRYNPYDLQVVAHKELKGDDYYTVSASGVTHFSGGTAEFIELPVWEREGRIFDQISELPVFRDYKKWRSFLLWRGLVRKQALESSRQFLTKNLFQVLPDLSDTLRFVQKTCLEFYGSTNMYLPPKETLSLEAYCTLQGTHLNTQRGRLDKTLRTIRDHVVQACKSAMLAAQLEREKVNVVHDEDDRRKRRVTDIRDLGTQRQPSYIEATQRRNTCRRLAAFIKLCDYLVVDCVTRLAAKAIDSVRADLLYPKEENGASAAAKNTGRGHTRSSMVAIAAPVSGNRDKKGGAADADGAFEGPLLSVEVLFDDTAERIGVSPSQAQVSESVEDIIRDYVRTATGVPRLLTMDVFSVYTSSLEDSSAAGGAAIAEQGQGGPDVAEMIVSEPLYKTHMACIRDSLTRAFGDIHRYAHSFDSFKDMYISNAKLDTDAILQRTETLAFFREHLALYKSQTEAVASKIPNSKDVALCRVFSEGLREFVAPSPVACLEAFHHILPIIAHQRNESLLAELQKRNAYLSAFPKTVEHYVEYIVSYKKMEAEFEAFAASYDFIRELFALVAEEKIEISEEDEETYRSGTRPQFDKLRTLMQVIEDGKEAQQRLFTRNIDEQMEQLRHSIEAVYDKAGQPVVTSGEADVPQVIDYVTQLQAEAEGIAAREKELRRYQLEIGAEETTVDTMLDMLNDVNIKARLWVGIRDWDAFTEETQQQAFDQLDMAALQDTLQKYTALVKQVSGKLTGNAAVPKLKAKVEEWRQLMPILQALKNPKMKAEHHASVSELIGKIEDANGTAKTLAEWGSLFTVEMLLTNDIGRFRDDILAISAAATEEDKLQQQIDKINASWNGGGPKPPAEFAFHNHKEIKDLYTLVGSSVEDVAAMLEDSLVATSAVGSSKFCQGVLRVQVDRWENRLRYMQETLDRWVELQRSWIYLENIFSSSEIRSQWKEDAKRFEKVDRFFRDLMRKAHDQPTAYRGLIINSPSFDAAPPMSEGTVTGDAVAATTGGGSGGSTRSLKQDLENSIKELEKVLSNLEKKLEEKRRAFPRFYFLSNDDLLDVLAKVKTPELMMPHMLKMFDGIKSLSFGGDGHDITHLLSMEGERVELVNKNVKARGPVETWMEMLEREMFFSLRRHAQTCLEDYEERHDRSVWMFQHPVQLVLIAEQILWTRSVEDALDKQDSDAQMEALRHANYKGLEELAGLTVRQLSKVQRILLSTLITIDVHGRDLVDEMCTSNVVESTDFGWTKQLRAYWEKDDDGSGNVFIRQNNSRFVYGFEYLGAQGRLVITPLTDRIYMTITGALKLYLGASPAGPAGTGKTETVKDLAKNLARQCIVYNCSDGVTYKMMEKFFSGLIQTGAWTCLDEFNRINIEVLSVIASQLLEIKLALQNKRETFTFQGTPNVRVRATYGAFVTMNPGYAGRTELPDNLKILFRPVAVMTPDFRMIAEVILYSEGFKNAKDLSLKITQLYKLSSEQLSPQDHYDFGMRALKSILVMAGELKRSQPDVPEDLTLIVACNDSNVPKFVAEDLPLFRGIMQDLFPGVSFPERQYTELLPAMHQYMESKKLVDAGDWVRKGIQFYETLMVRHGVMLVGVTGTGKTEIRECIADALTSMAANEHNTNPAAQTVHQFVMNPKAVLLNELYGQLDVNTNEWKDGVLAAIAKSCVRDSEGSRDHRWIVFDGPVDTLWIESLNSVLDDSKLLCLDSGERIKFPDTIHMLFEVADLAVASPATVSRCGMVYVDSEDLPWSAIVGQWSETKLAATGAGRQARDYVTTLFNNNVGKGLEWLRQQKRLISAGEVNVVQSMCDLFTALMKANSVVLMADPPGETVLPADDPLFRERNEMCNALFVFSYIWSVGGNVDQAAMESFDTVARNALESLVRFPNSGSVFDVTIDFSTRLFIPWDVQVPEFIYHAEVPFFNILVPTVDTVRYSTLARTLLQSGKPLLFSGQTGVGKSVIMADCLQASRDALQLSIVNFQFSAQTSSERTQELIETKLKQKRKNVLGAAPGKNVVLFIDDMNMPSLEVFGASPPIELLRQLMGNGGFYDRKVAGFWKYVQDVTVVAACGPPEGGRNPITPRLTRLFHLLQIPNLTDDSMRRIFGCILQGFLDTKNFAKEVRDLTKPLVLASVDVFNKMREGLRPRPATPHYTFNLRDVAKVFQGMTQVVPRVCREPQSLIRLWVHECTRCFYDRLASADDRRVFVEDVMADPISRLCPDVGVEKLFAEDKPIVWADFMRFGAVEKVYEEVSEFSRIGQVLDEYQDDYNATVCAAKPGEGVQASQLNLVFFKDHCEHLARIIRIVRQPRGNALLVGVGGSGKRSLTRLASYVAGCRVFEISVGKGYSMAEFHEFLLEVYTYAGVQCKPCVFLLSDNQIVHDSMLEDVNNILNSGEVPSLFTPEEREKRVNACLEAAQQEGVTNRDEVYNFFLSRVRDNLHIALCMSPVGDMFRTRCRQFPSLTNCCVIDWFDEWPVEALAGVAERLLRDLGEDGAMPAEVLSVLPKMCVDVHTSIVASSQQYWEELRRRYYVTPTSYLEFIETYKGMFMDRRSTLGEQLARVENGKAKMMETDETIAKMREEIEVKRPQLEKASQETETVVADLSVRQAKASEVQVQVRAQQSNAATQQKEASQIAAEANGRLAEAKPIIDRAKAALDTIQASDLNELRSFTNPPSAVLKTTQACMAMFESKDFNGAWSGGTDWKGAREFLSYRPLLDMIRGYPTDNVKPTILQKIQKYINDDEFTVEICSQKGSQTCGSLCAWVHAVNEYSKVVKEVAPMRQAAAEAEQHLAETNAKLAVAQQQLQDVEKELAELQLNYERSLKKKNDLEKGLHICITRLENAEMLSESLKSEGSRWTENITSLQKRLAALPLQSFIASACVAYFGAFTPAFRKRVMTQWVEKLRGGGLDASAGDNAAAPSLISILGDPVEILNWQVNGLPTDDTSTENAIVATFSVAPRRWPLLIDPQEQGLKWLTRQFQEEAVPAATQPPPPQVSAGKSSKAAAEARRGLRVVKLSEPTWMRTVETQIRLGGTIIVADVGETLDPALEPLIARRIFAADGGTPQIQLTVQSGPIDYHPDFRLFLCTKLPNPHYLPDISTRVALLNFTVTPEGLEEQMLGEVVSLEKRDLEQEKNRIIGSISEGQTRLKEIEETILERLRSTQGNILDDSDLIRELKSAQANAEVLGASQKEANEKMAVISVSREKYRCVAVRASVLFFVLSDIARIDPMYQYSLQFFTHLVHHEIETTVKPAAYTEEDESMLAEHLHTIVDGLTATTYKNICRGLFNKDKVILSLLIATSIARHDGVIGEEEWQYLVRATALVASQLPPQPAELEWMTRFQWELTEALTRTIPAFHGLVKDSMQRDPSAWQAFAQSESPQTADVPCGWDARLTAFQRILLIRCLREEKIFFSVVDYVTTTMGPQFMQPPPFDLVSTLKESSPSTPIIFVLSQGADPMDALQTFAKAEEKTLQYVSLGQGQGENAKKLIASCRRTGAWAMLQNCHLSKSFMPDLELEVASLQRGDVHPDFRLWLTSMPTDFFPIFVLQISVKVTNEPPTGLRANMVRCFNDLTPEEFDGAFPEGQMIGSEPKTCAFKKLLYGLCFFHSIVLERKKFGPLGWSVRYEWNDTDFHVSKQWLRLFFEEQETIPWESLEYIIGQINYGGRVTDPLDRGTLQTILRLYLCPAMLEDDYPLSASGKYLAPSSTATLQEVREHINAMSLVDEPEVFGMHENASLRYQLQTSQYLLSTIVSIQPRVSSGGKKASQRAEPDEAEEEGDSNTAAGPEEEVRRKCRELAAALPESISRDEAGPNSFTTLANGLPNSMSTVLTHEVVKYNKLLSRVRGTLGELEKALQGLTVLSADLDAMYTSFLADQVPQLWSAVSYTSLKPLGAWYRELLEKVDFIRTWVRKGEPSAFWMGGFFNPSAFMTGAFQAFARAEGVSVDRLGFRFAVLDEPLAEIASGPDRGCYVYGMYADAWRWDQERRVMTDSLPGEPYAALPVVHFLPEPNHKKADQYHAVPLYRTTVRAGIISSLGASSNYVLSIEFPSEEDSDYWLLKGAACVCALDQ